MIQGTQTAALELSISDMKVMSLAAESRSVVSKHDIFIVHRGSGDAEYANYLRNVLVVNIG